METTENSLARCTHCYLALKIPKDFAENYFQKVETPCPKCAATLDWWDIIIDAMAMGEYLSMTAIGAQLTSFSITVNPDTYTELQFTDHGIASDARIIEVWCTPYPGGPQAVNATNRSLIQRHPIPHNLKLFPIPSDKDLHNETQIYVVWLQQPANDIAWESLTDAFLSYVDNRYQAAIVPANVAVELTLNHLLSDFLQKSLSKRKTDGFLQDMATYGHQLNVLLPVFVDLTSAPRLPDHILDLLRALKGARDDIAHEGKPKSPVEKKRTADYLCAALFGVHYLNFVRPILLK